MENDSRTPFAWRPTGFQLRDRLAAREGREPAAIEHGNRRRLLATSQSRGSIIVDYAPPFPST